MRTKRLMSLAMAIAMLFTLMLPALAVAEDEAGPAPTEADTGAAPETPQEDPAAPATEEDRESPAAPATEEDPQEDLTAPASEEDPQEDPDAPAPADDPQTDPAALASEEDPQEDPAAPAPEGDPQETPVAPAPEEEQDQPIDPDVSMDEPQADEQVLEDAPGPFVYTVRFQVTPEDAAIAVYPRSNDYGAVDPLTDLDALEPGLYHYIASAEGYETAEADFAIEDADLEIEINLQPLARGMVKNGQDTFDVYFDPNGGSFDGDPDIIHIQVAGEGLSQSDIPDDPTRDGFVFIGWWFSYTMYDPPVAWGGPVTFVAQWLQIPDVVVSDNPRTILFNEASVPLEKEYAYTFANEVFSTEHYDDYKDMCFCTYLIRVNNDIAANSLVLYTKDANNADVICAPEISTGAPYQLFKLTLVEVSNMGVPLVCGLKNLQENDETKVTIDLVMMCGSNQKTLASREYTLTSPAPASYAVTVSDAIEHGTVTAAPESAAEGATVTLTVTPDASYELATLTATYTDANDVAQTAALTQGTGDDANKYTFSMPAANVTVSATFSRILIPYVNENGIAQESLAEYTVVDANTEEMDGGWYVVMSNVTNNHRLSANGDVCLLLYDGATLTLPKGIAVTGNNSLTIYGQAEGSGQLKINAVENNAAGIGGDWNKPSGTITICGGTIGAEGASFAAGIGGGGGRRTNYSGDASGGTIHIKGGTITAEGGSGNDGAGAGIGGGYRGSGGTITISGGAVTASGGLGGAGIGGGDYSSGGSITITGGTVNAHGDGAAAGIGGGIEGSAGTISITGGTVTATGGGSGASSIGAGASASGGTINITGGKVTANRIGSSYYGESTTDITLGWTNDDDLIQATEYSDTVAIATGQRLMDYNDNDKSFAGSISNTGLLANTKLVPDLRPFYLVSVSAIINGSVGADKAEAIENATVTLTVTPDVGYELDTLTVTYTDANDVAQTAPLTQGTGDDANKYTFSMPAANVTVSATFRKSVTCTASLTLKDNIDVNLYLGNVSAEELGNYTVQVKFNGADDWTTIPTASAKSTDNGYKFKLAELYAYQLTCPIEIQILCGSEEILSLTGDGAYSAKQYLNNLKDDPTYGVIARATLNYGAEAQKYFHGKTYKSQGTVVSYDVNWGNLANAELTEAQQTSYTGYARPASAPSMTGSIEGLSSFTASLILGTETSIKVYFRSEDGVDGLTAACSGGKSVSAVTDEGNGLYSVKVNGIKSYELKNEYDITLTRGEASVTVRYSAYAYANYYWEDAALGNLVKALYAYGVEADDVF